jgi:hypothetical protein
MKVKENLYFFDTKRELKKKKILFRPDSEGFGMFCDDLERLSRASLSE